MERHHQFHLWTSAGLAALVLLAPRMAEATGCQVGSDSLEPQVAQLPGWDLRWENDSIIGPYGTDRFYTQGMRLSRKYATGDEPPFLARTASAVCESLAGWLPPRTNLLGTTRLFLGQHLFTPRRLEAPVPSRFDRPYAAWLYVGTRLDVTQRNEEARGVLKNGLFHSLELQLGTTGHPAAGEWVQRNWHEVVHAQEPMGWDYQIAAEPGLQLSYRLQALLWTSRVDTEKRDWQLQWFLDPALDVGTLALNAELGTTLRFGRNLSSPVDSTLETPSVLKSVTEDGNCWRALRLRECFLFVRYVGRAVAHNTFLDGSLFRDDRYVRSEPFIRDFVWGARLRWNRIQLEYSATHRSNEFTSLRGGPRATGGKQGFGALSLQCIAPLNSDDARVELVCPGLLVGLLGLLWAQ